MRRTTLFRFTRLGGVLAIVATALLLTAGLLWQTSALAQAAAPVDLPAQAATPTGTTTGAATGAAANTTTLTDVLNIPITSAPTGTVVAATASATKTGATPARPASAATATSAPRLVTEAVTLTGSLENTTINSTTVATPASTPDAIGAAQVDATAGPSTEVLTGTIFANRTTFKVQFFLDGQVYALAPRESMGLTLRRVSTIVNLYSCEAERPESDTCFWDSYPVRQDGFYEINNGAAAGEAASLLLEEAGAPPGDQIWIQNRTGQVESVVYGQEVLALRASETQQIEAETEEIATLFLRSCVALGGKQACEWAPVNVRTGAYYALVADAAGPALANATRDAVTLETVAGDGGIVASASSTAAEAATQAVDAAGDATAAGAVDAAVGAAAIAPGTVACVPQVLALNVRAGPGVEYLILGQAYSENGAVAIAGQDTTGQWLALEGGFPGGWIINDPAYAQCQGNLAALPLAPIADGRLTELEVAVAPAAVAEAPAAEAAADAVTGTDEISATDAVTQEAPPAVAAPPAGGALFVVNNGFDHEIRFTLNPNEYDLQPGQSVNVQVNPGFVRFSVSSPWGGLSGNKELFVEPDTTRVLFLRFEPNPNSDEWTLQFE